MLKKLTKMYVFDMAGTTINERGIVYNTLKESIRAKGIDIDDNKFHKYHGKKKLEVIQSFIKDEELSSEVYDNFQKNLKYKYFETDTLSLMPYTLETFEKIKKNDDIVCLNTGYSKEIASQIINKLNLDEIIDDYICSDQVTKGRPYPCMINSLMDYNYIENSEQVIKVGDTVIDILEGKNANTGQQIGVLTGADDYDTLKKVNPTRIINNLNEL